ncbi:MAG: hypothetical protein HPY66_1698 [Firmicutes bacterium]|nr:hypothetical protein [Bacillota bacterium]
MPKISDEQWLPLYHKGMSDKAIGTALSVHETTIWHRRKKLGLAANGPGFGVFANPPKPVKSKLTSDQWHSEKRKMWEVIGGYGI